MSEWIKNEIDCWNPWFWTAFNIEQSLSEIHYRLEYVLKQCESRINDLETKAIIEKYNLIFSETINRSNENLTK
jgi:hypothetical protein